MTDHRTNHCTLCMLIPLFLGIIGLGLLYWYTKESKAGYIENDLSFKSNQLLEQQQIGGVVVEMDGRDAVLTGTVVSDSRSIEIEQTVAALPGIRVVDNQLEFAEPEPVVEPATVKIAPEPKPISEPEPEPEIALAPESEPEHEVQEEAVEELLQTLDLSGITFLFASDEITQQGKLILDDVVKVLTEHPEFDVIIEGHTDSIGEDSVNLELSQLRAQSILNYLASTGVEATRLTATGFGESAPIADNDSKEGRALNRRIEFTISQKQ